jgi:hypothetical protein
MGRYGMVWYCMVPTILFGIVRYHTICMVSSFHPTSSYVHKKNVSIVTVTLNDFELFAT